MEKFMILRIFRVYYSKGIIRGITSNIGVQSCCDENASNANAENASHSLFLLHQIRRPDAPEHLPFEARIATLESLERGVGYCNKQESRDNHLSSPNTNLEGGTLRNKSESLHSKMPSSTADKVHRFIH